jgi:hypothetical protein
MSKKVYIYVEGSSDKYAMESLLYDLIEKKSQIGIEIKFLSENGKDALLEKTPKKVANILINELNSIAIILPDLYPKDVCFDHVTFDELREGIFNKLRVALRNKHVNEKSALLERFKVFCFKYDLEALILASKESLEKCLNVSQIDVAWQLPVEDQNHEHPPKYIVKSIFESHGESYNEKTDAPLILSMGNYIDIANKCEQCFKPFVDFLESLS